MRLLFMLLMPFLAAALLVASQGLGRKPPHRALGSTQPHGKSGSRRVALFAGGATLLALVLLFSLAGEVFAGNTPRFNVPWVSAIGLNFSLQLDGLAFLFALLVLGLGALVVLYAHYYLSPKDSARRFFALLMLFMGAMLGLVLAGNLLLLVIFWELTSVFGFLLVGFWGERRAARDGARMALTITALGGMGLLAGVLLLGQVVGSFELEVVLSQGDLIRAHPHYLPILLLIFLGIISKSAQFPLHFWLPHAMAAPTPVSAYLHSATLVKAGVFLLARMYPALAGSDAWFFVLVSVGLITLLLGSMLAIVQQDLKGLLAYSTIAHLGLITMLFGLGTELSVVAALFHIVNHATFKASLFMAAGIIDHETGSRDFRKLNGLWKYMPITAMLAIVASMAMAGVPLLNGFLSKEMFFASALSLDSHRHLAIVVPALALLAAIFSVTYSLRFIHDVFFNGLPVGLKRVPHEPARFMRVPVECLVVLCLAVGMLPNLTVAPLLKVAVQATLQGPAPEYHLAIWHGFNAPLLLSALGLVLGVALYFALQRFVNLHSVSFAPIGKHGFDRAIRMLRTLARRLIFALANGRLQTYLALLLLTILGAGLLPFVGNAAFSLGPIARQPMSALSALAWLLIVIGSLATVLHYQNRVVALMSLSVAGLGVALLFVQLAAPDLVLTQVLVEILSLCLLLGALRYLPQHGAPVRAHDNRWLHALLALASGLGLALLTVAIVSRPSSSIAEYFLANTVPLGGGANAVNVIIVDFRGLDTLGEIVVFVLAALIASVGLSSSGLRSMRNAEAPSASNFLLKSAVRLLWPLLILFALHLFLRGHNAPGGGFVAGLVLALGVLLLSLAQGSAGAAQFARWKFERLLGVGLLIALISGTGSWIFGHPFLTSSTPSITLPIVGGLPLASAMGFDLAVMSCVFGAAGLLLQALLGSLKRADFKAVAP